LERGSIDEGAFSIDRSEDLGALGGAAMEGGQGSQSVEEGGVHAGSLDPGVCRMREGPASRRFHPGGLAVDPEEVEHAALQSPFNGVGVQFDEARQDGGPAPPRRPDRLSG